MLLSRKSAYAAQDYTGSAPSRVGIAGTIAVHAILVAGYFLIPAQVIQDIIPKIIFVRNIPLPPAPPEPVVEQKTTTKPQPAQTDTRPFVPDPTFDFKPAVDNPGTPIKFDSVDIKPFDPGIIDSPRNPVLTAVSPDPRYMRDFQPDYPPRHAARAGGRESHRARHYRRRWPGDRYRENLRHHRCLLGSHARSGDAQMAVPRRDSRWRCGRFGKGDDGAFPAKLKGGSHKKTRRLLTAAGSGKKHLEGASRVARPFYAGCATLP
ncbi:hypothetical protein BH11PSE5_BH11PSE5_02110 [soil metagenome]